MITLGGLLDRTRGASATVPSMRLIGDESIVVSDVTHDSRSVRPGALFCCLRGGRHDGHDFADEAVRAGAAALLVDHGLEGVAVPQIVVADTREVTGRLAAAVHDDPSGAMTVVGVTGTNGKTTTAHMLGSILRAAGRKTTVLGTLTGTRTTPEATDLQRTLAHERSDGTEAVVMEVSSHALALRRVVGTRFAAAVFTNLGHDHLDFHGSMEEYFAAKASLFRRDATPLAIVNRDDVHGRRIAATTDATVVAYGRGDASDVRVDASGSTFVWRGVEIRCAVGGGFNVMNALAAATTAAALEIPMSAIADGLATLPPIAGRFENVNEGGEFAVIVDYAHTPEALRTVLETARQVVGGAGRVLVVFGCGGDRDPSKRPSMGDAACAADTVVVTSDNPRGEDPAAIVEQILAGVPDSRRADVLVEIDRRRAIELGCRTARRGDVVVIAGRGHERFQSVAGREIPFDDAATAREVLEAVR